MQVLSHFVLVTTFLISSTAISAIALETEEIKAKVANSVIRIDGAATGTGFIIKRNVYANTNTYTVLTTQHGIDKSSSYKITTVDGKTYPIDASLNREIPNTDLVEIQFTSNLTYIPAQINATKEALYSGKKVYSYGFNSVSDRLLSRNPLFLPGNITGNQPSGKKGYSLTSDLKLVPGLSGSPLFDENGNVIGIYGSADIDVANGNITLALGIPIITYLKYRDFENVWFRNNSEFDIRCELISFQNDKIDYTNFNMIPKKDIGKFQIFSRNNNFRCSAVNQRGYYGYFAVESGGIYDLFSPDVPCVTCPVSRKNETLKAIFIVLPNGNLISPSVLWPKKQ
jgi:Trypsin-like peptidase domain